VKLLGAIRAGAAAAAMLIALLLAGACESKPAPPPPDQVYTVRGRITGLPQKDKPLSELTIHHEPIPGFVRQDGTLGMDSMDMPFTPAPGVSLSGLSVGSVVEFTFEVRWKARPFSQLTKIRALPRDTVLNLGKVDGGQ
jgi:hypothetical protein